VSIERLGIAVLVTLVAIEVLSAFAARGSGALLSDTDSVVWLLLVVALAGAAEKTVVGRRVHLPGESYCCACGATAST
jgi:hypothetical protein